MMRLGRHFVAAAACESHACALRARAVCGPRTVRERAVCVPLRQWCSCIDISRPLRRNARA
eukprot:3875041-Lingulodinium_polyedra.AAC.1